MGDLVGKLVGGRVGALVGGFVGFFVGALVGTALGDAEGASLAVTLGLPLGAMLGLALGDWDLVGERDTLRTCPGKASADCSNLPSSKLVPARARLSGDSKTGCREVRLTAAPKALACC